MFRYIKISGISHKGTSRSPASVTNFGVTKLGLIIERITLGKTNMWLDWRWERTTFVVVVQVVLTVEERG